ncbi:MAG: hypothetical protein EOM10_12705, partial [Opitutae bacterium]|nr:hypothetical protein [Opitutae bacterium]
MAGAVTGVATTFGLPNYHGELFALTPADTPLLSAIGGLTGGGMTDSTQFEWQTYDLRDASQPATLEGATAPTAQARVRANVRNVCQIHQEKVSVSYTKQAATGQYATPSAAPYVTASGAPTVVSELDWQVAQAIRTIARDVNWSFINGRYNLPTTNAAARKTKGILQAITTNLTDKGTDVHTGASSATTVITPTSAHGLAVNDKIVFTSVGDSTAIVPGRVYYVTSVSTTASFEIGATAGGADITVGTSSANLDFHEVWSTTLTVDHIEAAIQDIFDNGGLSGGVPVMLVGSRQKRAITAAYATAYSKAVPLVQGDRIGGVTVDRVLTDFGEFGILLDRSMPVDSIAFLSLDQLRPVMLNVPGKGVFFEEALAKTGASDDVQIYGEIGLEYGNEKAHGVLRGLAV